jgi:hypothetical protein
MLLRHLHKVLKLSDHRPLIGCKYHVSNVNGKRPSSSLAEISGGEHEEELFLATGQLMLFLARADRKVLRQNRTKFDLASSVEGTFRN